MPGLATALGASRLVAGLEQRLSSFCALSPSDLEIVHECHRDPRIHSSGDEIVADTASPRLVASGWAGWTRSLADGRRQILELFLPGDVVGPGLHDAPNVTALGVVTTVDASPLFKGMRTTQNGLALAWHRAQAERRRQWADHLIRLGRLTAYERTASLIVELLDRARRAGLGDGRSMPWPVTQEMLADVLGISVVHVNRTLQQLRRDDMVDLRAGVLIVRHPSRLIQATHLV